MRCAVVLAVAVGTLLAASAPRAQEWQVELVEQAQVFEDCKVELMSQVVEREVGGKLIIFAKIRCEDGRMFDASRTGDQQTFTFKDCDPQPSTEAC